MTSSGESVGFVGLLESASIMGGFAWTERKLFGILGRWASSTAVASDAVRFADHSLQHAWHSQVWFDRLPELSIVDAEGLILAPSDSLSRVLEAIESAGSDIERVVGVYRVMCAHLIYTYGEFVPRLGTISAPSVERWVRFICDDLERQRAWGETRLRQLVASPTDLDTALGFQQALESKLICG